jgi:hypothetical protein
LGSDSDAIPQLFVRKIILAQQVDVLPGNHRAVGHCIEKHLPARGMGGLLARSCWNRNGANERESSTKGSTESLGILAQTFGRPAVSTACHGARTLWGRLFADPGCRNKRQQEEPPVGLEAGSQLKSQGKWLGVWRDLSVGLYVPLLEFNLYRRLASGFVTEAHGGFGQRGHRFGCAFAPPLPSLIVGSLFSSLFPGGPASRIFWKMTALLKPRSASPATPTAGPQSFMTALTPLSSPAHSDDLVWLFSSFFLEFRGCFVSWIAERIDQTPAVFLLVSRCFGKSEFKFCFGHL